MCTRKRFTEPTQVRLDEARRYLRDAREQVGRGAGAIALWNVMKALLNLERVKRKLDADSNRARSAEHAEAESTPAADSSGPVSTSD